MTATEPVLITYKKPWWKSKVLWFNAGVAAMAAAELSFNLLQPYLSPRLYALLLFLVIVINAGLRIVTTQGLRK